MGGAVWDRGEVKTGGGEEEEKKNQKNEGI